MKQIILLAFLGGFTFTINAQSSSEINAIQELAATFPSLGWAGGNVCNFDGVTCATDGKIIALDIGNNALEGNLPNSIGDLIHLKRLYIENNFFGSIPTSIGNITGLEELFIYNNEINQVPTELQNLSNLKRFWASSNLLTEAPAVLDAMNGLQYINLSFNELTAIPSYFSDFTALENLLLEQNAIEILPDDLGNLSLLQRLNIKSNKIAEMPSNINNITGLQFLLTSDNKLPFHVLESIKDLALLTFDYNPQDSLGEIKEEMLMIGASLTLASGDESTNSTYQWYLDGNAIDGATANEYSIATASLSDFGNYTCEITNTTFTDMTLWTSNVNVSEDATSSVNLALIGDIQTYPNPVEDQFNIDFISDLNGGITIEIFNNIGQQVKRLQFEKQSKEFNMRLDLSELNTGSYFVKVVMDHYLMNKTIIIK